MHCTLEQCHVHPDSELARAYYQVFPPTLVKEDEALPETADCRMT